MTERPWPQTSSPIFWGLQPGPHLTVVNFSFWDSEYIPTIWCCCLTFWKWIWIVKVVKNYHVYLWILVYDLCFYPANEVDSFLHVWPSGLISNFFFFLVALLVCQMGNKYMMYIINCLNKLLISRWFRESHPNIIVYHNYK